MRREMLAKRSSLDSSFVYDASRKIFERIKSTRILGFNSVLVYNDFKNEVRTNLIIKYLTDNRREVYLPKCDIANKTFKPVRLSVENMVVNKYGIYEPAYEIEPCSPIECVIVPGVAFDTKGNRIGFGAGYYDKFFAENPFVYKIGLCYEFQLSDELDADIHDVAVDAIVTEDRMILTK